MLSNLKEGYDLKVDIYKLLMNYKLFKMNLDNFMQ